MSQQWRLDALDPGEHRGNAPKFGGVAGRDHDAARLAVGHERARVGHIAAVAERRVGRDRIALLLDRHRLAGERGLLDAQVLDPEQPQIGGHAVAGLDQHHIAGHQLHGIDRKGVTVAQHRSLERQHAADRGQRPLGLAFLDKADDGVDDYHADDYAGVHPVAKCGGNARGRQQDIDQDIMKLQKKAYERPAPPTFGDEVRPDPRQTGRRLTGTQTAGRVAAEARQYLGLAEAIPSGRFWSLVCRAH